MANTPSLEGLPDELIDSILQLLDGRSLCAISATSSRLHRLSRHGLLWRLVAVNDFSYWSDKHSLPLKLLQPVAAVDWLSLVQQRRRLEREELTPLFDAAVASQVGRTARLDAVTFHGYDARGYLLRQLQTSPKARDYLARTYWARHALAHIDRAAAVRELIRLREGGDDEVPLERALACLDLCIADRAPLTLDEVTALFDTIAETFEALDAPIRQSDATLDTPRERALRLVSFCQFHSLLGVRDSGSYYDLQNSLITVAMLDHGHPSLPLVSAAIFSALARRIGVSARLVSYPRTVHVLVSTRPDATTDLNGRPCFATDEPRALSDSAHNMYLDITDTEGRPGRTYEQLAMGLRAMHVSSDALSTFLAPMGTCDVLLRAARNLEHSREVVEGFFSTALQRPARDFPLPRSMQTVHPVGLAPRAPFHALTVVRLLFFARAMYAENMLRFLHAGDPLAFMAPSDVERLLLPLLPYLPPRDADDDIDDTGFENDRPSLPSSNNTAPASDPTITPQQRAFSTHAALSVRSALSSLLEAEAQPPTPMGRNRPGGARDARHRVGTVFVHARFGYAGMVVGWDRRCAASEDWMAAMDVDSLAGGRAQVFYNVADSDGGMRYVAEENIVAMGSGAGGGQEEGVDDPAASGSAPSGAAPSSAPTDTADDEDEEAAMDAMEMASLDFGGFMGGPAQGSQRFQARMMRDLQEEYQSRPRRPTVPHPGLMRGAGQWFLRWDERAERFVSNVREAYPDD